MPAWRGAPPPRRGGRASWHAARSARAWVSRCSRSRTSASRWSSADTASAAAVAEAATSRSASSYCSRRRAARSAASRASRSFSSACRRAAPGGEAGAAGAAGAACAALGRARGRAAPAVPRAGRSRAPDFPARAVTPEARPPPSTGAPGASSVSSSSGPVSAGGSPKPDHCTAWVSVPVAKSAATSGSAIAAVSVCATSRRSDGGGSGTPATARAWAVSASTREPRAAESSRSRGPCLACCAARSAAASSASLPGALGSARASWLTTHAARVGLRNAPIAFAAARSPASRAAAASSPRRPVNASGAAPYSSCDRRGYPVAGGDAVRTAAHEPVMPRVRSPANRSSSGSGAPVVSVFLMKYS